MSKKTKKILFIFSSPIALTTFPMVAFADAFTVVDGFISVLDSIIPLAASIAVMIFFWGMVKFINHAGDEKAVEEGKQIIVWGLVGLFCIFALWAIVGYIQETLDIGGGGGTPIVIPTKLP